MLHATADQPRSEIIKQNPIGNGFEGFRASYKPVCNSKSIPCTPDALDLRKLALAFLSAARNLAAPRVLPARAGRGTLRSDLLRLELSLESDDSDLDRIKPLLKTALAENLDDALVWSRVYDAVTESTPPPRSVASVKQTPWSRNTSSIAHSSEHRKYVDGLLKEELGPMYVGLPSFYEAYFGDVPNLETASEKWFADFTEKLTAFAEGYNSASAHKRRPLARPHEPIAGSVGKRKMDVGFVDDPRAGNSRCKWSQILVPGELKSNPSADMTSETLLDLGRYAWEVFAAQDARRFVLGFTLCTSLMRQFDINEDGLRFVPTILGFLWMSEEQLGFDPTIKTANGQRFIEIERDGGTERIIFDGLMKPARCIAGRATTCWKGHREEEPHALLVAKDSWQYPEREQEGELLREATDEGVVRVARHYHHVTVRVRNADDVQIDVRKGLDCASSSRTSRRSSVAGVKRPSTQTDATLPPNKHPCSTSPIKTGSDALPNRVHRRIIISDYGIPIYEASSPQVLLAALADCIEGHASLRQKAGLLHRDISIGNLMVSKDNRGFLIDLDLAIKEQRISASGAKGKTGTRAFMAIGPLLGEQHSFMHDLESFFWVLFWICIHCNSPGEGRVVAEFDRWNYADMKELAKLKKGQVSDEGDFISEAAKNFTQYYQPMVLWVNRLRKDSGLYMRMREVLDEARKAVAR
ncbi:dual serine/threonine and tyrosine protein kinase [Achaetomium macrosporum]|uniref:non-specific serine/threonine protein kinase n=1 Tax=Achaetomium macrosporum TaxID=79813 RepID=A0AAN7C8Z7_9PEZI|nr:dual serine/threonine and tyrosine protein kinase [Achaetomium macrosporum]